MDTYDAYLFDLDGTLVDTAPDLMGGLNVCLAEHGYSEVDEALTRRWVGHGVAKMIEQALAHQGSEEPPPDVAESMFDRFLDYYAAHIADESTPYPGVREALASLGQRASLGVVTNKVTRLTAPLLDALDLAGSFEVVVCSDTVGVFKPAADPALHACASLGVHPAQTLFVGDSVTDVQCARAAGCDVVCVPYGYSGGIPPENLGADRLIESLTCLV
ncbi:MAG: phosphoglycolate phosphatase [Gammaproteobacteria bacterium]|nr:phosphoglycolate phosphatase [Gammaproteobacteria bacterium]